MDNLEDLAIAYVSDTNNEMTYNFMKAAQMIQPLQAQIDEHAKSMENPFLDIRSEAVLAKRLPSLLNCNENCDNENDTLESKSEIKSNIKLQNLEIDTLDHLAAAVREKIKILKAGTDSLEKDYIQKKLRKESIKKNLKSLQVTDASHRKSLDYANKSIDSSIQMVTNLYQSTSYAREMASQVTKTYSISVSLEERERKVISEMEILQREKREGASHLKKMLQKKANSVNSFTSNRKKVHGELESLLSIHKNNYETMFKNIDEGILSCDEILKITDNEIKGLHK